MPSQPEAYQFRPLQATASRGEGTLQAALAEADAVREAARAQGEAEGRADAERAVREEAGAALALLAEAHTALTALSAELLTTLQADCAGLAVRLAEQIIAGAIEVQPERIAAVAGMALRRLADRRVVTLVVNPAELEILTGAVNELRAQLGGIDQLSVQADRRVSRGGVLARTAEGEIDVTVEAQLERTREIIAAELRGDRA